MSAANGGGRAPIEDEPQDAPGETTKKDEEVEIMGGGTLEALPGDPSILAMKLPGPQYRYTRAALMALKDAPLSKKWPEFLDGASENLSGILWDRKSSETPTENGPTNRNSLEPDNHRRRSGDPRERLRKEGDGIVLGPQRRSFNTGCCVPNREPQRSARGHSPLGKSDPPLGHREIPSVVPRRIGSGRIPISWDFQEKQEVDDFGYRRDNRREPERDESNRFERRSFGRDFEINRDKEKDRHTGRNGRYDRRRISTESKEEEPEWFSGGPVSQNDTIELRGFDDSDKAMGKKKRSAAQKKRSIDRAIAKNNEKQQAVPGKDDDGGKSDIPSSPTSSTSDSRQSENRQLDNRRQPDKNAVGQSPVIDMGGAGDAPQMDAKPHNNNNNGNTKGICEQPSIDFDDFLKSDSFSGFITNGVTGNDNSSSKFSRWFNHEKSSPGHQQVGSRRSSVQDQDHHQHLIQNLLSDISEPNVSIPGDSDSYFAPISPAANTGGANGPAKPLNLMEMLQRGKQKTTGPVDGSPMAKNIGKLLSLEELEARMLPGAGGDMGAIGAPLQPKPQQQKSEDIEYFRRLLAQVTNNSHGIPQNGPIPQPQQPMSILEMLSHSQQQDEAARIANQMMGNINANPLTTGHINDINFKLQQAQRQVQVEMLSKLVNPAVRQQPRSSPPLVEMGISQSRELLNRPEAQAILQALHQRIPSPRELQVHTQNIMQRALIKKKLEEQQENYRKKQEMQQRGQSPAGGVSPAKNVSSPTPLAFTPTSVLRKMTAEKEDAGRPIVKANNNFQQANQQQQQEQFYQQQQQQQQQRLYNHPGAPQRKAASQQQFPMGNPGGQFPQGFSNQQYNQLTQQQLRAQHQQQHVRTQQPQQGFAGQPGGGINWQQLIHGQNFDHRNNVQVGRPEAHGGDLSPTSNQLARWFSPELLERARKGKVPNLPNANMAMHAMSLEDIERQAATPVVHN